MKCRYLSALFVCECLTSLVYVCKWRPSILLLLFNMYSYVDMYVYRESWQSGFHSFHQHGKYTSNNTKGETINERKNSNLIISSLWKLNSVNSQRTAPASGLWIWPLSLFGHTVNSQDIIHNLVKCKYVSLIVKTVWNEFYLYNFGDS